MVRLIFFILFDFRLCIFWNLCSNIVFIDIKIHVYVVVDFDV